MLFNLTHAIHWVMFVCASFYQSFNMSFHMPEISRPHFTKPEINVPEVPKMPEVDEDQVAQGAEIGKIAANMTGHETTEEVLGVALEYTKSHDNMSAYTSLIETLLSDGLDKQQVKQLQDWDKKIDAAIALGVFMPQAKEQMNEQVKSYTGGHLDIDQLDLLIHAVLGKHKI